MSKKSLCKGCLENVIVTEEVIQELLLEAMEDMTKVVNDHVYVKRLTVCQSCPSLYYGTTCIHSGSIVRYRAKFKNNSCPFPCGPKW
ncbi:DUF6171 family protein [Bacillus sp. V2I10]|uniref:DUF6171 family protein n=1 Tax=Bacillus sp. V2I10 TaxID=3042276 RepID=UPI00277F022E|nr:DUF6171 family protein [Bacillus sp. V2I10]MDQ0859068.1 Fe-S cluster biogenesis protein NfuA [Bacillus sp. V2I10]